MKLRNFGLMLLTLTLLMFNSCKKETVDMTHLLTTVPSSAGGVVVFNIKSMLEDTGCKVKDHVITPSKEVLSLLDEAASKDREDFLMIFNGDSGIEPEGAVLFFDSNRSYLTVALYDTDKFCSFIEAKSESKFTDEGSGVKVCGRVAVKGAQAWILFSENKRIDSDAIASYASLKDSQSFLVTPAGEKLLVEENDIRGWALINTLVKEMPRQMRSAVSLGLGFVFEDPDALSFKVDFKKGEMEIESKVLNEKGKPAKYLLPTDKVDVNLLKDLGTTCGGMMAFTINQKLLKKFEQIGNSFGGALFGDMTETFKNVDGTIGLIAGGEGVGESVSGVITTKGEVSSMMRDLISNMVGSVSQDGKYLRFSRGDVKGPLNVAECAEELKGCCLGLVVDISEIKNMGYEEKELDTFRSVMLKFKPDSGSIEYEIEVKTMDPKENSLMTLLKM